MYSEVFFHIFFFVSSLMLSDQRNHMDTGVVRHFCLLNGNNEPFLLNSEAKYLKKIMLKFLPRPLFSWKLFQNSFKTLSKLFQNSFKTLSKLFQNSAKNRYCAWNIWAGYCLCCLKLGVNRWTANENVECTNSSFIGNGSFASYQTSPKTKAWITLAFVMDTGKFSHHFIYKKYDCPKSFVLLIRLRNSKNIRA